LKSQGPFGKIRLLFPLDKLKLSVTYDTVQRMNLKYKIFSGSWYIRISLGRLRLAPGHQMIMEAI
jgi:hypothetical protein